MMKRVFPVYGLFVLTCLFLAVSCNRNTETCGPCKFELLDSTQFVIDVEGNIYSVVKIGKQTWLGENLRTRHYADGSPIDNTDTVFKERYYFPAGNVDSVKMYGVLYNWAAARHAKDGEVHANRVQGICPTGFHLPSDEEWHELVDFVTNCTSGKKKFSPAKMLAVDSLWKESVVPNTPGMDIDSNNTSLFGAVPTGHCYEDNEVVRFYSFHSGANFWSSTPYGFKEGDDTLMNPNAYGRYIGYNDVLANKIVSNKKACFSVRCVKD